MLEQILTIGALSAIGIMIVLCVVVGVKEVIRTIQSNRKADKGCSDITHTVNQMRSR